MSAGKVFMNKTIGALADYKAEKITRAEMLAIWRKAYAEARLAGIPLPEHVLGEAVDDVLEAV